MQAWQDGHRMTYTTHADWSTDTTQIIPIRQSSFLKVALLGRHYLSGLHTKVSMLAVLHFGMVSREEHGEICTCGGQHDAARVTNDQTRMGLGVQIEARSPWNILWP